MIHQCYKTAPFKFNLRKNNLVLAIVKQPTDWRHIHPALSLFYRYQNCTATNIDGLDEMSHVVDENIS